MQNLLKELRDHKVAIPFTKAQMKCQTFEDNAACIELAKEHKLRPRSKHLAVRLFHFRLHVEAGDIKIQYVSTMDQLADIFTKPLPRPQFLYLRKMLMGR